MNDMTIKSNIKKYTVSIESDFLFLDKLLEMKNTVYVIDKNVYESYGSYFASDIENLLVVEATEENKTIETALKICERLTELSSKRNSVLVSIGGGIIQDITGFVSNITYRGINWIYVPTTVLAACDSCIGGKTSLNYKKYKNLLGTFYPPSEIKICPEFFKTLSKRDYYSGLGEVIKFNIMKGNYGLEAIENDIDKILNGDFSVIKHYLLSSLEFKKAFIEKDEFDNGERIKLNFAHTFGHAIEVITNYEIPHGTSVAIGMIMANSISCRRGLISEESIQRMEIVLLRVIDINLKLMQNCNISDYISVMRKDKKQTDNNLTAVLITNFEKKAELTVIHDLKIEEIDYALNYFMEIYRKHENKTF